MERLGRVNLDWKLEREQVGVLIKFEMRGEMWWGEETLDEVVTQNPKGRKGWSRGRVGGNKFGTGEERKM